MADSGSVLGSLASTGIEVVSSAIFGSGARKAQQQALDAQKHLFEAQATEQQLKNAALAESLGLQNAKIPFAVAAPSKTMIPNTGAKPDVPSLSGTPALAGLSTVQIVVFAGLLIGLLVTLGKGGKGGGPRVMAQ